jgi:hypothetical protein
MKAYVDRGRCDTHDPHGILGGLRGSAGVRIDIASGSTYGWLESVYCNRGMLEQWSSYNASISGRIQSQQIHPRSGAQMCSKHFTFLYKMRSLDTLLDLALVRQMRLTCEGFMQAFSKVGVSKWIVAAHF